MSTAKAKGFQATKLRHTCFVFTRPELMLAKIKELMRDRVQFSVVARTTFWEVSWSDTVAQPQRAA